jgi:hypothetical protein
LVIWIVSAVSSRNSNARLGDGFPFSAAASDTASFASSKGEGISLTSKNLNIGSGIGCPSFLFDKRFIDFLGVGFAGLEVKFCLGFFVLCGGVFVFCGGFLLGVGIVI